jgi:DNA repair photolyase
MINPIYQPTGRAKEYCELAINIYSSCNHGCTYCYAKKFFDRYHPNENFSDVKARAGIVEATAKQLSTGKFKDKTIQLCFMCDPYPHTIDTTSTREVIKVIKEAGAHVQILTKGGQRAERDFDLLDSGDSFGITLSCLDPESKIQEPKAAPPIERIETLSKAAKLGIKTWVSFEPVIFSAEILNLIIVLPFYVSKDIVFKVGKLNHVKNDTDWKAFGLEAERICKENGRNYYIKEDLRAAMEAK